MKVSIVLLFATLTVLPPASASGALKSADSPEIEWQLIDPFPLLGPDFNRLVEIAGFGATSPRVVLDRLIEAWRPGNPLISRPAPSAYDSIRGHYKPNYVRRSGELVEAKFRMKTLPAMGSDCRWSVVEGASINTVSRQCDEWAPLFVPMGNEVLIKVSYVRDDAPVTDKFKITATQRIIVAMGDSFASGEGNPDVPAIYSPTSTTDRPYADWLWAASSPNKDGVGEPALWWDRECHRSLVSWPVLASLQLALNDRERKTRHVLLSYACSGAEMLNGIFQAQLAPPGQARSIRNHRDGAVPGFGADESGGYESVERSQINAMFDDLCRDQPRKRRVVAGPPPSGAEIEVRACDQPMPIDTFLLSIGGNDVGFARIAMGMVIPKDARGGLISDLLLSTVRSLVGADSLDSSHARVLFHSSYYVGAVEHLLQTVGVAKERAIVVKYPDPVGKPPRPRQDNGGVRAALDLSPAERLQSGCTSESGRHRLRDTNLVMSKMLSRMAFGIFGDGWTVELSDREQSRFSTIFGEIAEMQGRLRDAGISTVEFVPDREAEGLRLCDEQVNVHSPAMPLFFCGHKKVKECVWSATGEWQARPVSQWRHYGGPTRRLVHSLNDSVLALRPWRGIDPSRSDLLESMKGSMHPVAHAHAAAAHAVVDCIHNSGGCRVNASGADLAAR